MKRVYASIIALLLLAIPASADAAAFVKFHGIQGGSSSGAHSGWTDVIAVEWSVANTGKKNKAKAIEVGNMMVTTKIDDASPSVHLAALNANTISNVRFEATESGSDRVYYKYELRSAKVVGYSIGIWQDGDIDEDLVATVELEFQQIAVTYVDANGEETSFTWTVK